MKKQFGRSMIEMLGVLAIIGVLSIGGIVMYRRAVTKYLTNNLIDDVNLSGFLVMDELFNVSLFKRCFGQDEWLKEIERATKRNDFCSCTSWIGKTLLQTKRSLLFNV